MELYFFRHGDAEPAGAGRTDEERQLTARGREETLAVAQMLARASVRPDIILTSPLLRARQTADILSEALGVSADVEKRLRPGCALGDLQAAIGAREVPRLLLVGHEPDFSQIVGRLAGGGRVEMEKSGLARVDCPNLGPGEGVLVWLASPPLFGI